jgi:Protein of unknown function (DUF3429)
VILPKSASVELDKPPAIPRAVLTVGIAGCVPFAAAAFGVWIPGLPVSLPHLYLAGLAYGAVVLSFVSGARWGAETAQSVTDSVISALPPLAGWIALLIEPLLGLCLLIAAYFLQAFWNVASADRGVLPYWFGIFSSLLTSGAVIALLAMLLKLLI